MRNAFAALVLSASLAGAGAVVHAAEPKLGAEDTVLSILSGQKGARITVRVRSGVELNGIVREVNARALHLATLGGKEYFDAVVSIDAIEAVYFRTKQ